MSGRLIVRLVLQAAGWSGVFFAATLGGLALLRPPHAATPVAYAELGACQACPGSLRLSSVQVEQRSGSILFVVRGSWPGATSAIPDDVQLVANDVTITLRGHQGTAAFAIVSARKGSTPLPTSAFAASLRPGMLLVDIQDSQLTAPVRFHVAILSEGNPIGSIPAKGEVVWDGHGRPHR